MDSHIKAGFYDIIIIGGGMVGASLAVALKNTALKIAVIEQFPVSNSTDSNSADFNRTKYQPSYDARSTAISWGSRLIYQRLGLWDMLSEHVTPIKKIHVSDRGQFGAARLNAKEHNVAALGYVVPNEWIGTTLTSALKTLGNVDFFCPAKVLDIQRTTEVTRVVVSKGHDGDQENIVLSADLVVIADGGRSESCQKLGIEMRVESYGQHALIANVTTSKHHGYEAYERFTETGPMAMLPTGELDTNDSSCALVWTLPEQEIDKVMSLSDEDFITQLQERFGYRLGKIVKVGARFNYPLKLSQATEQVRSGVVVVGNAAHALHPVAGQGYNLSLRGVVALAELLKHASEEGKNIGALSVLLPYLNERFADQDKTILFSDKVTRLFGDTHSGVGVLRDIGLIGLDILPVAKRLFARQAMGIGGTEAKFS